MEDHSDKYNCGADPLNIKGTIFIMHDQKFLNDYFSKFWCSSTDKYIYSGYAIAEKLNDNDYVIDIGCGTNPFKGHIKNLLGIDPTNIGADVVTTIEDFEPNRSYDVALCLGSINFGTEDIIANQIRKVNSLLHHNARVFWRLNPGQHDHVNTQKEHLDACDEIDFFPWSFETLGQYASKYGFEQVNCANDTNGDHVRLYAEWKRDDISN